MLEVVEDLLIDLSSDGSALFLRRLSKYILPHFSCLSGRRRGRGRGWRLFRQVLITDVDRRRWLTQGHAELIRRLIKTDLVIVRHEGSLAEAWRSCVTARSAGKLTEKSGAHLLQS